MPMPAGAVPGFEAESMCHAARPPAHRQTILSRSNTTQIHDQLRGSSWLTPPGHEQQLSHFSRQRAAGWRASGPMSIRTSISADLKGCGAALANWAWMLTTPRDHSCRAAGSRNTPSPNGKSPCWRSPSIHRHATGWWNHRNAGRAHSSQQRFLQARPKEALAPAPSVPEPLKGFSRIDGLMVPMVCWGWMPPSRP